jgi:hypothetical protein
MMIGYGVGLSWGAALTHIDDRAVLGHAEYGTA